LKFALLHRKDDVVGLLSQFRHHNDRFQELVNAGDKSDNTLKKYKTILSHLRDFLNGKDIPIKKVDTSFINDFHHYLISVKGIKNNTTVRYCRLFGCVLRKAKRAGVIDDSPGDDYNGKNNKKATVYLTPEELKMLVKFKPIDEPTALVKDLFLFACYTGLSFADIEKLSTSEVYVTEGRTWVSCERQKNSIPFKVLLIPQALEIFERYSEHREVIDDDSVFPVPSNQHVNRTLKAIIGALGIQKRITFHKARHTFASAVAIPNGMPMEYVSKVLGHRTLKTTEQFYAEVRQEDMIKYMDRIAAAMSV
jgi:site-specific recombinase XerD